MTVGPIKYLQGVVPCVGFSKTLPACLESFTLVCDRVVVVTADWDTDTQSIAKNYGAEVVITDRWQHPLTDFDKGTVLNDGIRTLEMKHWLLCTDADCIVHPGTRKYLQENDFDIELMYGTDIIVCPGHDMFDRHTSKLNWTNKPFPASWRSLRKKHPVGPFQLFHPHSDIVARNGLYPTGMGKGEDRHLWVRWKRKNLMITDKMAKVAHIGRNAGHYQEVRGRQAFRSPLERTFG
tara:strand:- start:38096 stop:38803 length:708 start_codon:yes stop_codon:yes gene_type:complete